MFLHLTRSVMFDIRLWCEIHRGLLVSFVWFPTHLVQFPEALGACSCRNGSFWSPQCCHLLRLAYSSKIGAYGVGISPPEPVAHLDFDKHIRAEDWGLEHGEVVYDTYMVVNLHSEVESGFGMDTWLETGNLSFVGL